MTNNPNLIQIIEKLGSQIEEIKGSRDYLNERLEKIGETYKKLNVVSDECAVSFFFYHFPLPLHR